MPDNSTSGSETLTDTMTDVMATTTTSATDNVDTQQQQQQQQMEENSLLQLDAGDEGRLQIVVEDPTTDDDEQRNDAQDSGQCPPSAVELVEHHANTAATACPSTSADDSATVPAYEPPVSHVTWSSLIITHDDESRGVKRSSAAVCASVCLKLQSPNLPWG